jgi:hypothetical protein
MNSGGEKGLYVGVRLGMLDGRKERSREGSAQ